jgi:hypothetical protein
MRIVRLIFGRVGVIGNVAVRLAQAGQYVDHDTLWSSLVFASTGAPVR